MMALLAAVFALVAVALQIGVLPALFLGGTGPLLPVALLAAWAGVRHVGETWPMLLLMPLVLGAASEERAGWFLLALLPTAALSLAVQRSRPRWMAAAPVAALGAWLYLALLTLAAGRVTAVPALLQAHLIAALWTAVAAAAVTLALHAVRPRGRGLFE